jgi:two-component system, LuxR family, sensor kinase FixL
VEIRVQEQDKFIKFCMPDNGSGVAPAIHARSFAMFQTLRSQDEIEGSGIGLAPVKRYVERRGGTV